MTKERAKKIISAHKNEKYYSISPLQVGEIEIGLVTESGFTYSRKTEFCIFVGIYEELYSTDDIYDCNAYRIAELIFERYKQP